MQYHVSTTDHFSSSLRSTLVLQIILAEQSNRNSGKGNKIVYTKMIGVVKVNYPVNRKAALRGGFSILICNYYNFTTVLVSLILSEIIFMK